MIWVSIFGADSYSGSVLSKLVASHPYAQISTVVDSDLSDTVNPYTGRQNTSIFGAIDKSDLLFSAVPYERNRVVFDEAASLGKKIIDISAMPTFKASPQDTGSSIYGLAEINKNKIQGASIVKNPDCFTTGAVLGLAPLVTAGLIDKKSVIIDSKSGISAASKCSKIDSSFVEMNENTKAYKLVEHNYEEEIENCFSKLCKESITVNYTPYLIPLSRGIMTSIYATPAVKVNKESLAKCFNEYYADSLFVRVLDAGTLPQTRDVAYSNYCDIGVTVNERTGNITVVTAMDNMMKGAAGQAVQNMNLMCGFNENSGLEFLI